MFAYRMTLPRLISASPKCTTPGLIWTDIPCVSAHYDAESGGIWEMVFTIRQLSLGSVGNATSMHNDPPRSVLGKCSAKISVGKMILRDVYVGSITAIHSLASLKVRIDAEFAIVLAQASFHRFISQDSYCCRLF